MNEEPKQTVDEDSSIEDRIAELEGHRRYDSERIQRLKNKLGTLDMLFDSLTSCHRSFVDTRHFTEDRLDTLEKLVAGGRIVDITIDETDYRPHAPNHWAACNCSECLAIRSAKEQD